MKLFFVDSFTDEPFKGNPAGVCLLDSGIDEEKMQKIAREIGFSETAFIRQMNEEKKYSIRYFSPKKEIPLCGHATLASAKVLFETTRETDIFFITRENIELNVKKLNGAIMMGFPVYDTIPTTVPSALLAALGVKTVMATSYSPKNKIVILEVSEAKTLAALTPDFEALLKSYDGINGVLVTAPSDSADFDFHYRYFWPWAGTNEDPATGGVQTFLTKYWSKRLNKTRLKAFQSSERSGQMTTELQHDKVLIYGEAVIILEGQLKV